MNGDELSRIAGKGVSQLGLGWPPSDSIFELRIRRHDRNTEEYLDFLYLLVFPLIEQLEIDASVEYWHVLNHGDYLDLRLLVLDENQIGKIESVLAQHDFAQSQLQQWEVYDDPNLGSRLGCQALLRLYNAQSKFVRDLVRSIYWLRGREEQGIEELIPNILYRVPIYTSHILLNIFPADVYHEAVAHLQEGEGRFRHLLNVGALPQGAGECLNMVATANRELFRLLSPKDTEETR